MLELKGISKSFPGVKALDDVSFEVRAGEVHGLLGENGAGKSTILKIISGAQRPSAGEILWNGKPVHLDGPQDAQRLGIVTIYQEFNLIRLSRWRRTSTSAGRLCVSASSIGDA